MAYAVLPCRQYDTMAGEMEHLIGLLVTAGLPAGVLSARPPYLE
jgi:hypothetical protein